MRNFEELRRLITPDKHPCIKCNQHLARIGIICDICINRLNAMAVEFGLPKIKEEKKEPTRYNSNK